MKVLKQCPVPRGIVEVAVKNSYDFDSYSSLLELPERGVLQKILEEVKPYLPKERRAR